MAGTLELARTGTFTSNRGIDVIYWSSWHYRSRSFCRAGTASNHSQLRKAPARSADVGGADHPPTVKVEYGWRDTTDICFEYYFVSCQPRQLVWPDRRYGLVTGHCDNVGTRSARIYIDICRDDRFLLFLLYGMVFNPREIADNLKKSGAFVPGVRPGVQTANYIDRVVSRLTLGGAIYLTVICLIPEFLIVKWSVPFYFGGTSLLIIVVVAMDLMTQVQSYLMSRQYESLMKKSTLAGGLGLTR